MDFERDIANEIVRYFEDRKIKYDRDQSVDVVYLLERYFRIRSKLIASQPRAVHYSAELQAKLGTLDERYRQPLAEIEERFESGGDLAEFLSKLADNADAPGRNAERLRDPSSPSSVLSSLPMPSTSSAPTCFSCSAWNPMMRTSSISARIPSDTIPTTTPGPAKSTYTSSTATGNTCSTPMRFEG